MADLKGVIYMLRTRHITGALWHRLPSTIPHPPLGNGQPWCNNTGLFSYQDLSCTCLCQRTLTLPLSSWQRWLAQRPDAAIDVAAPGQWGLKKRYGIDWADYRWAGGQSADCRKMPRDSVSKLGVIAQMRLFCSREVNMITLRNERLSLTQKGPIQAF